MNSEPLADYKEENKKSKEHFKTPLEFAKWRVNELLKPVAGGIINETIDVIIELVNGILGQHIENDSKQWGKDFEQFEMDATIPLQERPIISRILAWLRRGITFLISSISLFPGLPGKYRRILMPIIIYGGLFAGTLGAFGEYNFNIYRLLALLLLYIISYTELTYGWFCILFLIGIGIEIGVIVLQMESEES